jgi:beta-N-acetylhexosaminidase
MSFVFSLKSSFQLFSTAAIAIAIFLIACKGNTKHVNSEYIPQNVHHTSSTSIDAKIGQMLMIGFRGLNIDESTHIKRDIEKYHLGGVVLYSIDLPSNRKQERNIQSPTQLTQLNQQLQALSSYPLLIGIDQEGGMVNRLSPKYGFPPKTPSPQALGTLDNLDSTYHYALKTAELLKKLRINFNFAPSVDVNVNPTSPVIGGIERSFSAKTDKVTAHAEQVIKAHLSQKIICSLKHFPGHGSAKTDSHKGFTDVTDTWTKDELLPYKALIEQKKVQAIMTAHVFNAKLDKNFPATLSKDITYKMLRQDLGYNGFIISDDMHMGAIADNFEMELAIEKALNAGVDMLMFSNNSPKAYDSEIVPKVIAIIKKLLADGKITEAQIDAAYNRIVALKSSL